MSDEAPDPTKILKTVRQAMSSAEIRRKFHAADSGAWRSGRSRNCSSSLPARPITNG
jgi:hypothetical protein